MAVRKLFNTRTQQVEDAVLTVDPNNEIVATFEDGGIIKFPAGLTKDQFEELIAQHQAANEGQEIITAEMEAQKEAERAASLALIGETPQEAQAPVNDGNTMPESEQYNATPQETEQPQAPPLNP